MITWKRAASIVRSVPAMKRREALTGVNATLAWTGLILSVLTSLLVVLPVGSLVKTLAVLAFACFGPGSALLCRVRLGIAPVAWAVALVVSISLFALPSAVMVWIHFWHPFYAFAAMAAASIAAAGSALRPAIDQPVAAASAEPATERPAFAAPARFRHVPVPRVGQDPQVGTDTMVLPLVRVGDSADPASRISADVTAILPRIVDEDPPPSDATAILPRILDDGPPPLSDATAILPRIVADDLPPPGDPTAPPVIVPPPRADSDSTQVFARITDSTIVLHLPDKWDAERSAVVVERPNGSTSVRAGARLATMVRGASLDRQVALQVTLLTAALVCWVTSLSLSNTADVGDYGLLAAMHPLFFVGVALCVAGFVVEIGLGARRGWLLLAHLALLLLIMHATVPILLQEPEYAWTYKHIGVIQLFRTTGRVVDPNDIYQAWPTFFTAVAQLGTLSGASTISIARWGPLFFDVANCLPLYAIVRTLSGDRRLPYLTVFVFTAINWIGQDYLSPQAFAYVLCLGAILIMVRWLRGQPGLHRLNLRLVNRAWTTLHVGLKSVPYVGKRTERTALASLYFIYAIVVMSHQLSPYLIAMSAGALVVLGLMRTWQVVPILLGISLLYLLPHYGVADHYGLFDGINIFKNLLHGTQGVSPTTGVSTAGEIFSAEVVQLLSLVVWGTSAIAVLMSRSRLGPVALPAVLAFSPFALLLAQSYGGEGIYRVYLFSAPWCAYLICRLLLGVRRVPKLAAVVGASLLVSVAALIGMQGEHGQLTFDQFTPDEVAATTYFYQHAPAGALLIEPADNMPDRLTARYVDVNGGSDPLPMDSVLPTDRNTITDGDMERIAEFCTGYQSPVFVVLAKSETNYAHYFGYLPDGLLANLQVAMDASPFWKVMYRNDDAVVYRFES